MKRIILPILLSTCFFSLYATHCDGDFSGSELTVSGCNSISISGDCTGACYDFFDLALSAGDVITLTVTTNAMFGFNPNFAVFDNGPTFDNRLLCVDNDAALTVNDSFTAPADDTYRFEISDFVGGFQDGNYSLTIEGFCNDNPTMMNPIPTMGEWGLICLSFLLLIFGVVTLKKQVTESKKEIVNYI